MNSDDRDEKQRPQSAGERYAPAPSGQSKEKLLEDAIEQVGPFYGRERQVHGPALSLTLKLKNGNAKTLEYAHRCEMDYDGERIELFYSTGVKVTIAGNHLQALYDDLAAHRVVWIESRETLHALKQLRSDVTGQELPVVLDIIVERGRLDVDTGTWQPASGRWNAQLQVWEPARMLN